MNQSYDGGINDTMSILYTTEELPMEVNQGGHGLWSDYLLQSELWYHPSREVILHDIVEDERTLCGPQTLITSTDRVQSMACS
jgi:hypothetical protein